VGFLLLSCPWYAIPHPTYHQKSVSKNIHTTDLCTAIVMDAVLDGFSTLIALPSTRVQVLPLFSTPEVDQMKPMLTTSRTPRLQLSLYQ